MAFTATVCRVPCGPSRPKSGRFFFLSAPLNLLAEGSKMTGRNTFIGLVKKKRKRKGKTHVCALCLRAFGLLFFAVFLEGALVVEGGRGL